eukprot:12893968-Prorocentrum_lima.AAC.1
MALAQVCCSAWLRSSGAGRLSCCRAVPERFSNSVRSVVQSPCRQRSKCQLNCCCPRALFAQR